MRKTLASIVALATIAFAGAAAAESPLDLVKGDYVQAQGGGQFGDNYGGGATWSVAAGRDFGQFRGEVEYLGSNVGYYGTLQSGNVNVYYEPSVSFYKIAPFVGAGVGYGRIVNFNSALFNVQAGLTYPLTSSLKAVVAYRYTDAASDGEHTSALTGGLRFTF
jgi:opacity protein-like surface antigen